MKQVFKFDHKTVIYHGNGQYTVTADHGFILREQGTGNLSLTAYTSDYSRYEVIADEGQLSTPSNEENQEQEPATEEIQEQEPANETRKEAAEEQPKPTNAKKSKKTSVGK